MVCLLQIFSRSLFGVRAALQIHESWFFGGRNYPINQLLFKICGFFFLAGCISIFAFDATSSSVLLECIEKEVDGKWVDDQVDDVEEERESIKVEDVYGAEEDS